MFDTMRDVDVFRLLHMQAIDAMNKGALLEKMSPEQSEALYEMKGQLITNKDVSPINDNAPVITDEPKYVVSGLFRENEREMIDNEIVQPAKIVTFEAPTPQKIKTNIFLSYSKHLLHWGVMQKFNANSKTKLQPLYTLDAEVLSLDTTDYAAISQETPAKAVPMETQADGNVIPFKRKILSLNIAS